MPKVLRIINRFNLGGPTYNVSYLSKYLPSEYETLLVGGLKDDSEESSEFIPRNLGIEPLIIPEMKRPINPLNDLKTFLRLRSIIKEFKPDIVHTHASKAGTLGRLAAITCGIPVIIHTFHGHVFHSYFGSFKTAVYKNIERFLAKRSSAIIAISEIQKEELCTVYKICNSNKTHVIPLGFDLDKFRESKEEKRLDFRRRYQIADDEIAVIIIGRLVPVKNHTLFLESLRIVLNKTNKKVRAFIIGDGTERQHIENKARELKIEFGAEDGRKHTLTFTSWIKNIDWVCAGADIIVLTSFNEGTPVSLIEAQAGGKPIVTTNVGGIENVVIPGKTAFLINSFDKNDFANYLLQLVEDDTLRKTMGEQGISHVMKKFHYSRLIKDTTDLYLSLL